jgi:NAD(P)-dependent dehydrogenase (short-subunit alcohol dehydrogenase family)
MAEQHERCAVVTGAARGIGRGIAMALAGAGYRLVLADTDGAGIEAVAAELGTPGRARAITADVGQEADADAIARLAREAFGRIDALVNNAGIAGPYNGPLEQLSLEEWERRLRINLTGPFLCSRACAPSLREARGAIVNIASTRALQSEPDSEAYAASKGGLVALTHAMAVSLGPQVRVNAVSPGWIDVRGSRPGDAPPSALDESDHHQHPVGRVGTTADIGAAVTWLLSDAAGFITGQNLVIDGGMTRLMIYRD